MRTALLAAVKRTAEGELRAELTLGGRSVLGWQVDLVQALACKRVICLCEAQSEEILALQRQVEAAGSSFHSVRGPLQLAGLVHADDELVMLRDGLLPERTEVMQLVGNAVSDETSAPPKRLTQGIVTLPAGHPMVEAQPSDFERIDATRHWAGLAVMRGAHIHQLADFPPDGEVMSLLLRLALQARVECRPMEPGALKDGRWLLASNTEALVEQEQQLIRAAGQSLSQTGLGGALASKVVTQIAPRWLSSGSEVSAAIAGLFGLLAFGMAVWGVLGGGEALGLGALIASAAAALAAEFSVAWTGLRTALWPGAHKGIAPRWLRGAVDAVCALSLVVAQGTEAQTATLALAITAIGLARLAGEGTHSLPSSLWRDRAVHMAVFAFAAASGFLGEALALFTIGAVAQLMLRARGN